MRPSAGVNFTALDTRFHTTCCSRDGSPSTVVSAAEGASSSTSRFSRMVVRISSITRSTTAARDVGRASSAIVPATILLRSWTSLSTRASARTFRSIVSMARTCWSGGS